MFNIEITDKDLIQSLLILLFGLIFYDLGPWFAAEYEILIPRYVWLIVGAAIGFSVYFLYDGLQSNFKIYRAPNILILSDKNTTHALSGVLFLSKPKNVRYEGLQRNFAFKHTDNDFGTCFILRQKLRGVNWATLNHAQRRAYFNELTKHTEDFHDAVKRSMRGVQIVPLTFEQLMIDRGFAVDVNVEVALPTTTEDEISEQPRVMDAKDPEMVMFTPDVISGLDLEELPDIDQTPPPQVEEVQLEEPNALSVPESPKIVISKRKEKKETKKGDSEVTTLDSFLPSSPEEVGIEREQIKKEVVISELLREIDGSEAEP